MREFRGANHCICSGLGETDLDKNPWHSVSISFLMVPTAVLLTFALSTILWKVARRLRSNWQKG
jgi:hypothetical protein